MKKIWIALAIIVMFILADIGVRIFLMEEDEGSVVSEKDIQKNNNVYKTPRSTAKPSKKVEKEKAKPKPKGLVLKRKSTFKTCEEMTKFLLGRGVDNITDTDIKRISYFDNGELKSKNLKEALDKYFVCKAVVEKSMEYCKKDEALMGDDSDCRIGFKNIVPVLMKFVDNMDLQQFQVAALAYPDDVKDHMINLFKAMDLKEPEACLSIGEGEDDLGRFICSVTNGRIKSDKDLEDMKTIYWGIKAIKERSKKYLSKIKDNPSMYRVTQSVLGQGGSCEILLKELSEAVCE